MDEAEALAKSRRASVIAAAGCGKTELIARAVAFHGGGRDLILTHTHAGVEALRTRLRGFGVPPSRYRLDTIAGWALRLAAAFPAISALQTPKPRASDEYAAVYSGAAQVLQRRPIREIIRASYSGAYVDEYQDCTSRQHALVVALSEDLPCRVIGDPLQGVFDFESDTVDWKSHVEPLFGDLPGSTTPWRWQSSNPALGEWLLDARERLESGCGIDLCEAPVRWVDGSEARWRQKNQRDVCFDAAGHEGGSVIAIHKWPTQCESIARHLNGLYSCVEAIDTKDLYRFGERIGTSVGFERAVALIDFAATCMTKVGTELKTIRNGLECGHMPRVQKHISELESLLAVTREASLASVGAALQAMRQMSGVVVFRRELLAAMRRAVDAAARGEEPTLSDAAWAVRNRTRQQGRLLSRCAVGTTLLVKGLQFDHAVVLDADCHDAKNLYVAMTRGAKSLTIVSRSRAIQPIQQSDERGAGEVRESAART